MSSITSIDHIWSPEHNIATERMIWNRVLQFHMDHGVVPTDWTIVSSLASSVTKVDLDSIRERERVTRHDLKARLEETIAVAKIPEVIHLGMTSADVVENAYLIRMGQTLDALCPDDDWAEWLLFRGIKGPVGTQQDQLDLLGSPALCHELDHYVAKYFGFRKVAGSVPQVMFRSMDLEWATRLLSPLPANDSPWWIVARGYLSMIAACAGQTWNEGDVSTSVVRRYAIPGLATAAAHIKENAA